MRGGIGQPFLKWDFNELYGDPKPCTATVSGGNTMHAKIDANNCALKQMVSR